MLVGPILDSTGAAVTTEVVASLRITKNGTVSSLNASATLTHSHSGMYLLALTASDADTAGWCQISLTSGTNAMSPVNFHVVETAVFDALFAASAAGYQVPIWAASNSTVNLSGTTFSTSQVVASVTGSVGSVTGNVGGNVTGSVGSVTGNVGGNVTGSVGSISGVSFPTNFGSLAITVGGAVTAGTVSDKTGYSLASGGLASVTTWTVAITGNITGNLSGSVGSVTGNVGGNVTGSVGSISGVSFPSNFASLGINASGHVSRVTLCDTITTYTGNTPQTGDAFARLGSPAGASIAADIATRLATSGYTAPPSASANAAAVRTELATELARIDVATSTRLASSSYTAPLSESQTRAAVGLAAADLDSQLDAILAAASATTGAGAYTRTITVNDGTTALQGAKVRLTQGAENYVGTTNASGQVVFSIDAATWSIAITKPGYSFTPTTLVVSGSGSTTYSMTASGPTPSSDPDKTTVRITCYGADTEPEASATVQLRQLTAPSGDEGNAFAGDWTTYTTDESGIVDVTLWSDATYAIRRGTTGDTKQFTPTGATDSFDSILSR